MHQGHYVGMNIYQRMLSDRLGTTPKFSEMMDLPPSMALAVGKNAVSYGGPQGVLSGNEIAKMFFEDDLGFASMYPLHSSPLPLSFCFSGMCIHI